MLSRVPAIIASRYLCVKTWRHSCSTLLLYGFISVGKGEFRGVFSVQRNVSPEQRKWDAALSFSVALTYILLLALTFAHLLTFLPMFNLFLLDH